MFRPRGAGCASGGARGDGGAGWFLAEGDLVVERAFDAGCRVVAALVDPDRVPEVAGRLGVEVFAAGEDVRRAVTGMGRVQPIVAVFERPATPSVSAVTATDRLVVVEAIDNPANMGSIIRNAAGLGWTGLLIDRTSADPLARRSLRVAMGTAFSLPTARVDDLVATLRMLAADGVAIYGLTPEDGGVELADVVVADRCAIVIGSERAGLSAAVLAECTVRVGIPLADGVDSLNAAAASAIACYTLRRPRSGTR